MGQRLASDTVPTAAPPPSLARIAARAQDRIAELLATERSRWAAFDADLDEPIGEIERLVLAGGKRLPPAFCHWGAVAAGGDGDADVVVDAGAAIELMHAFALFHDDVMDDAASRRGAPTTHVVFGDHHAQGGWAGEARRFGEGVAILVGDLAFVFADELMAGAPSAAWSVWNELRVELNVGQLLDIIGSVRRDRTVAKAERICRYKSGKYTIERPLHLGAVLVDTEHGAVLFGALSAYGLPLGDAFQMRYDVMGAFGDPRRTGKPVGGDLVEGKPTPLLARAVEAATGAQRAVLDLVGDPQLSPDDVGRIQEVIVATGALDALEAQIETLAAEACAAIEAAPIDPAARTELLALATYVTHREV